MLSTTLKTSEQLNQITLFIRIKQGKTMDKSIIMALLFWYSDDDRYNIS